MELAAPDGFRVSGYYTPSTRQFAGSSEEVTDANGVTSSEAWTATLEYDFGASANLIGLSTATFRDNATGATCDAEAGVGVAMSIWAF